tara:strand:- start:136 stop:1509 length:1374 start_codon:yes stop_codon:yes gene_type:complete
MNDQVQAELKKIFNGRFSTSVSTRTNYARGEDTYDPILSKAVIFPETNEEVSKILSICNKHKIPVVPFGTGTSLEGNVVGNDKGITISLEKMNKILNVNVEDFDCRVQACVTKEQLNDYLREDGVFFPIDPGANAAIGGMASTSASGTMAVKYGTMKTVITGLTVVLPNGDIINTGSRTKKTSAGYNLTNLFIGSEGTLGIITEVQLRLSPIPESIMAAVCHFPTLEKAVQTAQQVIQYGVPIARIEMLNKDQMGISINYSKLKDVEAVPTLFFEFHGSEQSNNENIKVVEEISKENSGSSFKWAKDLEDRNKLWKARWDVYYSVKALINNGRVYSTDVCLPISNITECVNYAEEQAKKFGLRAPMVGHLGDGNFHVLLPFDPNKKETYKKIREFNDLLIKKTLELNGTITGEHGVGLHKKEYLLKEHPDNIPLMKLIKRSIDQNNIMNPGKIFDLN